MRHGSVLPIGDPHLQGAAPRPPNPSGPFSPVADEAASEDNCTAWKRHASFLLGEAAQPRRELRE